MRTPCLSALCLSILAAACMRGDARRDSSAGAVDTTGAAAAGDAGATALLRSVAGKWNLIARPTTGRDSTPTRVTLNATADTTGWTMVLGGKTVALHVRVSGDTIITASDPYSSARREGVTVRTESHHRLDGDRLVGTTVAHYVVKGADSVLVLNTTATRAP